MSTSRGLVTTFSNVIQSMGENERREGSTYRVEENFRLKRGCEKSVRKRHQGVFSSESQGVSLEVDFRWSLTAYKAVRKTVPLVQFSLQANRKAREGDSHPDRDAQFAYINAEVGAALAEGQAVISVDTKKKELVGDFKNAGREWRRQGEPAEVRVHDFLIKELGRAVPYGICDLASNAGWVSVGITHDTAAFAVQTIRRWWQEIGRARYREATASAW